MRQRGVLERGLYPVLVASIIALGACLLAASGLLVPIEDGLTARRAQLLDRSPTGDIVIVEIDAKSLARLSDWPWPRTYHADLVRKVHSSGAAIIAFDVDFSARSEAGDEELADAVRQAGNVVMPVFQQPMSDSAGSGLIATRPNPIFRDAWLGGVNIFPDRDGILRSYPAATLIEGAIQPSIATLVAERNGQADRSFAPDWAIDAQAIPRLSFVDVLEGRVPPRALAGKRVLVGATAIELGDRYTTPRFGVVPGVVIQALAAESLLQDRAITRTGVGVTFLAALGLALLLRLRPLPRPATYAVLALGLTAGTLAAGLVAQWLWPLAVDTAPLLFAILASGAIQAVIEARRRFRIRTEVDCDSGLPNRLALRADLADEAAGGHVLIAAAIGRFEAIRDAVGTAAANDLIRGCAERISQLTGRRIYRIHPDVLAWFMPNGNRDGVEALLDHVEEAFRVPVETISGPVDAVITLGLEWGESLLEPLLRIEHVLSAIGTARTESRTRQSYRPVDPSLRRQLSLMGDLRRAMAKGALRLAYQPKMRLSDGTIGDAEALIRWRDDNGRDIPPDEFIPLAESTGVIRELTVFAIGAALADLARWRSAGLRPRIAVNVSAADLAGEGFAALVGELLDESGVPASSLTLEVTESGLIRSPEVAMATLGELRQRGIRLAVDDYGTGQSTLSYLKLLPVHELKIDKSFILSLSRSDSDAILVRSTIELAHDLGLEVVAEGIEDRETIEQLRRLGCDYGQGYWIGRPADATVFADLICAASGRRAA